MRFISVLFLMSLFLAGCGGGEDKQADNNKSNPDGHTSDNNKVTPNNIYLCDNGSLVGINITNNNYGEEYDYYINGERLITGFNKNMAFHPTTKNKYFFQTEGTNLSVFVTDPNGNAVSSFNCHRS